MCYVYIIHLIFQYYITNYMRIWRMYENVWEYEEYKNMKMWEYEEYENIRIWEYESMRVWEF